jgi:putative acetyltransferase
MSEKIKFTVFSRSQSQDVINLFTKTFSDSEGKGEGRAIGHLVSDLIFSTDKDDIVGFAAILKEEIIGCIFFTRLLLPNEKTAFILSPVAIATDQQGKGIGQQLINYGMEYLRRKNIDLVFTYGDPAFYSKVGFQQIDEDIVKAPLKLSQPKGWLAQSLKGETVEAMVGSTVCVKALNKQEYW